MGLPTRFNWLFDIFHKRGGPWRPWGRWIRSEPRNYALNIGGAAGATNCRALVLRADKALGLEDVRLEFLLALGRQFGAIFFGELDLEQSVRLNAALGL